MFAPKSEWVPPETLPDLTNEKEIAIDLETRDPDLKTRGPGWPTGNGEVVGVAVATGFGSGVGVGSLPQLTISNPKLRVASMNNILVFMFNLLKKIIESFQSESSFHKNIQFAPALSF